MPKEWYTEVTGTGVHYRRQQTKNARDEEFHINRAMPEQAEGDAFNYCHRLQRSESHSQITNRKSKMLGSRGVIMATLIEFYVPQKFKLPKRESHPSEQQGKIIEFQSASVKKSA